MKPYLPIPVEFAREVARKFDKDIVIICAWSNEHALLHTTTYGVNPEDKIHAAKGGEIAATALGMDLKAKIPTEDFRTIGAAKNAQLRDLADGLIHLLRSYQDGNLRTEPAGDMADKIEAIIKS